MFKHLCLCTGIVKDIGLVLEVCLLVDCESVRGVCDTSHCVLQEPMTKFHVSFFYISLTMLEI